MKRNRVNRVLENMEKMGLDQLIVGEPASVYYLTGRWIEPGERMLALLISKGGACALFVNRLFAQAPDEDMRLVEFDDTDTLFSMPKDKRTEDYITGRFG